jgi:hypothetical protein
MINAAILLIGNEFTVNRKQGSAILLFGLLQNTSIAFNLKRMALKHYNGYMELFREGSSRA